MSNDLPDEMEEQLSDSDETDELEEQQHDLDTENLDLIDPQLVDALQQHGHEEMLVEFDGSQKNSANDRIGIVEEWFTEGDDYRADTRITPEQAYALTMLRNLDGNFENVQLTKTQSWVDSVLDDFERYVLSIEGFARKQEENVLTAIFGDRSDGDGESVANFFARGMSNPPDGDTDE